MTPSNSSPTATLDSSADSLQRLRSMFAERFELDPADIRPEARLYEDLDLDSIDAVELALIVQEITGRNVTPQSFQHARTVEDIEAEVRRLLHAD